MHWMSAASSSFFTIFSSRDGDKLCLKKQGSSYSESGMEGTPGISHTEKKASSQLHGMFPSQKPLHMMWDMRELCVIYLPKLCCVKVVYPTPGGEDPPLLSKYTVQPCMSQTGLRFYYSGWHPWQIAPGLRRMKPQNEASTVLFLYYFFHAWILKLFFLCPFVLCWACGYLEMKQTMLDVVCVWGILHQDFG